MAAQRGDSEAFRALYDAYAPHVLRTALSLVRDRDVAEDVTQETFLSVHRGLGGFRGDADLRTWITRIAINRARDALRRMRNAPVRIEDLEDAEGGSPGRGVIGTAMQHEPEPGVDPGLRRILDQAIAELPHDLRESFLLREVGDLTYEEIAEALSVPVGTIRTRLFRARERLRKKLSHLKEEGSRT